MRTQQPHRNAWSLGVIVVAVLLGVGLLWRDAAQAQAPGGQPPGGRGGRGNYSLSDPIKTDPALRGAIDMHAHQDPDSNGPSYGQAARSIDAIDLVKRAKAAGMRGFVIKMHLDQSAGLAYYIRKLYPEMEVFGGMGSNLTTGPKVNPWAITHMTEVKGGWGRVVWMPSWDSEHSSHEVQGWKQPAFISVARCQDGKPYWANYPKPCANAELLPEVRQAIGVIAKARTRDSNGELILATGHNGPEEVKMMVQEAVKAGVKHIIVTHPRLSAVGMSHEQIKEVVGLGPEIYAEFTSQFGRPTAAPAMVKDYVAAIRAAGVEHAFVSSDTGQLGSEYQPDALALAAQTLRKQGFTDRELDLLFKVNPAKILGIAPPSTTSP
jgi:hypothetical protein